MKVRVEELGFAYGEAPVLSAVALDLPEGAITAVIGPSGSGKSTLLGLLAGLLTPRAGRVLFDGRDVAGVPTEKRDIGVVFQSYALFPHLSVRDNIAFGLRSGRRRRSKSGTEARVDEVAALLGLTDLLDRRPAALSGGEQQRAAVARAIAPEPAFLLLDEPLSALDAQLRRTVRAELAALLRRLGTTVFYVTHDQEEAMWLADHLVVLNRGRVEQAGAPLDLYRRPATPFVAGFLGEANLVPARVEPAGAAPGRSDVSTGFGRVAGVGNGAPAGAKGWLLLRPEDLGAGAGGFETVVVESRGLGPYDRVVARLASGEHLLLHLPAGSAPAVGAALSVTLVRPPHFLPGAGE